MKRDVDEVHRYPEIWNLASLSDCNDKKKIIWDTYNTARRAQVDLRNLVQWFNDIIPSIQANERNSKINSNNVKRHQNMINKAMFSAI